MEGGPRGLSAVSWNLGGGRQRTRPRAWLANGWPQLGTGVGVPEWVALCQLRPARLCPCVEGLGLVLPSAVIDVFGVLVGVLWGLLGARDGRKEEGCRRDAGGMQRGAGQCRRDTRRMQEDAEGVQEGCRGMLERCSVMQEGCQGIQEGYRWMQEG